MRSKGRFQFRWVTDFGIEEGEVRVVHGGGEFLAFGRGIVEGSKLSIPGALNDCGYEDQCQTSRRRELPAPGDDTRRPSKGVRASPRAILDQRQSGAKANGGLW